MNKDKIKEKFEKISSKSWRSFSEWVIWKQCSQEEMNLFTKWLNQLSEEELSRYIKKDVSILSVITNQTDKICKTAIQISPISIGFVKEQTKGLCELAIKRNVFSIVEIREQTVDLCLLALNLDKTVYKGIRIVQNPDYKTTLQNLKDKKTILDALK